MDKLDSWLIMSGGKAETQHVTYSTLANIPWARIQKIISESKPLVSLLSSEDRRSQEM